MTHGRAECACERGPAAEGGVHGGMRALGVSTATTVVVWKRKSSEEKGKDRGPRGSGKLIPGLQGRLFDGPRGFDTADRYTRILTS